MPVEATPASIREQMESERPPFECVIGQVDGVAGWHGVVLPELLHVEGRPRAIYLEDLYVQPDHRGGGYGGALLAELASIAVERGFARVDWQVLDWNTPSIEFYENVDAEIKRDWLPCRLAGDALTAMAARSQRA